MNIDKQIKLLKRNGFVVVNDVFNQHFCNKIIKKLELILRKRIQNKQYIGSKNTIVLYNYFIENNLLLEKLCHPIIDRFMERLIDKDYVLISAAARNKKIFNTNKYKLKDSKVSGNKWHTDNRYLGGKALKPSINYFAIIALDEFTESNGGTKYVPKSHLDHKKKIIKKNSKFLYLKAKKGSVIFLDSNLMHSAGKPSNKNRWSIFHLYSPWFVKPYYQFDKIVNKKKFSDKVQKLLHFNSIPPIDYNKKRSTLIKT